MEAFDLTCARCRLHRIDLVQGDHLCRHCRLLILNKQFLLPVAPNLVQTALEATKPWRGSSSMRSLWEVLYSRQRRLGTALDRWLCCTYGAFGLPIPPPPPRRGVPNLNLKGRSTPTDPQTDALMKKVRRKIKAIRAAQEEAGQ